ncbi:hypothetical protein [Spirosoma litoris]
MATKSTEHRLKELRDAINAIGYSVNSFLQSRGDDMHLLTIKTQLRALIATGGRNMKPLLLEMADKANIDLNIYGLKPMEPNPHGEDVLIDVPWPKTWATIPSEHFEKMSFRDWLQEPSYKGLYTNGYVSRNRLLREIADKSGSHYDEELTEIIEYIDGMQNVVYNQRGIPVMLAGIPLFLLNLASATCWLGGRFFLKANKDFHRIKDHDNLHKSSTLVGGPIRRMVLYGEIITKYTSTDSVKD